MSKRSGKVSAQATPPGGVLIVALIAIIITMMIVIVIVLIVCFILFDDEKLERLPVSRLKPGEALDIGPLAPCSLAQGS